MSQLRALVERIERIETDIAEMNSDKRDIYAEAKNNGFDVKALKAVIAYRRKDPTERDELDAIVTTYLNELSGKLSAGTDNAPRARAPARPQTGHVSVSPSNDLSLATSAHSAPVVQAQPIAAPATPAPFDEDIPVYLRRVRQ